MTPKGLTAGTIEAADAEAAIAIAEDPAGSWREEILDVQDDILVIADEEVSYDCFAEADEELNAGW
jgi:hypothetical protein